MIRADLWPVFVRMIGKAYKDPLTAEVYPAPFNQHIYGPEEIEEDIQAFLRAENLSDEIGGEKC